jgi:hypothetical protein
MSEGWPDFWIKGKYIELIDLINTVNLIKTIQQIDSITSISSLDTINTVNLIDTINTIKSIGTIKDARITANLIRNGSFETGDLSFWTQTSGNVTVEYNDELGMNVAVLPSLDNYIRQFVSPIWGSQVRIRFKYLFEAGGETVRLRLHYPGGVADDFDFTATFANTWYDATAEPTRESPVLAVEICNLTGGAKLKVSSIEMKEAGRVIVGKVEVPITVEQATASNLNATVVQADKTRQLQREGSYFPFNVAARAAGATVIFTPSTGLKAKVLGWSFYCDADVICELRFSTSGNVIAALPAKGAHAMNLIGLDCPVGDVDETVEIYVSGAANVKGWICVEQV